MITDPDRLVDWIGLSAVAMMAAAGVLEAGRKRFDLFGFRPALPVAAISGGHQKVRDILLNCCRVLPGQVLGQFPFDHPGQPTAHVLPHQAEKVR